MKWFMAALKKYADFSGRAQRSEFWFFILFLLIILIVLGVIDSVVGTNGILAGIGLLGLIIPSISVAVRRLHDIDKSGWFYFVQLIPAVGGFIFLYFMIKDGTPGSNQYGNNPKGTV